MGDVWKPWETENLPPCIQVSVLAWRFLLNPCHADTSDIEYQFPLRLLEAEIPMLSVKIFPTYGITTIQKLLTESKPKSAEQLITEYGLPRSMLFSCVRISLFLNSYFIPEIWILSKVWHCYSSQKTKTKGISLFYNLIQDKRSFRKTAELSKWESDLDTMFIDDQWQNSQSAPLCWLLENNAQDKQEMAIHSI